MFEKLQQVVELPVDVATDCHRGIHMLYVCLFNQNLPRFQAEIPHLLFRDLLAVLEKLNLAERE